mgnify:FL=1
MPEPATPPPLSLYVHVPWCVRKCPYCDFNSHAAVGNIPEKAYVDALLDDLDQDLNTIIDRTIHTIFIGGGTPSLLSPNAIERLLTGIGQRTGMTKEREVTMEANPGTVEREKFSDFLQAGINRLSIGIQSFDDIQLQRIGRIHNGNDAIRAAETAEAAGFGNLNLDLMYGLPEQTPEQAVGDLCIAIDLNPCHISWYELTLEPNTLFHNQPPPLPGDDAVLGIRAAGLPVLAESGYTHYEISAHAREGRECRHNLNYWSFGDYLGIGAGAHSKLTDTGKQEIYRTWKIRHPRAYLENTTGTSRVAGRSKLLQQDIILEFMMNTLRLTRGFSTAQFTEATGLPVSRITPTIDEARSRGLLSRDGDLVHTTDTGSRYLNELLLLFMPEGSARAGTGMG